MAHWTLAQRYGPGEGDGAVYIHSECTVRQSAVGAVESSSDVKTSPNPGRCAVRRDLQAVFHRGDRRDASGAAGGATRAAQPGAAGGAVAVAGGRRDIDGGGLGYELGHRCQRDRVG